VKVIRVGSSDGVKLAWTGEIAGSSFSSNQVPTPVAGEGSLLYVFDAVGQLSVFPQSFVDATVPTWGVGLPSALNSPTSASPTIGCNKRMPLTHTGILYLTTENGWVVSYIVDSKGLDSSAPWPKYGHDVRNTNNAAVSIEACP
jgi:hypothetical protein